MPIPKLPDVETGAGYGDTAGHPMLRRHDPALCTLGLLPSLQAPVILSSQHPIRINHGIPGRHSGLSNPSPFSPFTPQEISPSESLPTHVCGLLLRKLESRAMQDHSLAPMGKRTCACVSVHVHVHTHSTLVCALYLMCVCWVWEPELLSCCCIYTI